MDGKEETLMNSVALTMAINPNAEIDILTSDVRYNQLAQHLVEFFDHEDSLPSIALQSDDQLALANGSVFNFIKGGRSLVGRRPTLVIMDEGHEDQYAYLCGAPVVHLSREDFMIA